MFSTKRKYSIKVISIIHISGLLFIEMITQWWFFLVLCHGLIAQIKCLFRTREIFPPDTDPNLLVENLVRKDNYSFEIHHVTTEDGYILALHRIPPAERSARNQRVVLIMHGLLGCSTDWIITGQNRSLAYLLSDNGYDVWLGNNRGTTNSKNHTSLSLESSDFWNFSFHEMGIYDLPAMIDYILHQTGQRQLFYIGFSQGTSQFWILTSLKPEYNRKIKLMSALAPVAYMGNTGGILKPLSVFGNFQGLFKYIGYFELLANTKKEKLLTYELCREGLITQPLCEFIIYMIGGISGPGETDHSHLADYLQFAPAGCSIKQLLHFSMGILHPETFRLYDYGILLNFKLYKRFVPPEYPLYKVTAPVILYNGLNDFLSAPKDVDLLSKRLPNLLEKHTVTVKRISHFDFVYGKNIRELVYYYLVERMNNML
ncbi:lipase 3-like isoform X2 [Pseudomyrmex gracilis]|uniref:lipase 3-like isoform X2 n=1 Tax=Pseudomyrmex gracilis TaxID=219809 RepID=UPI00099524EB|nr:lipase 3-like isoform X2 [Pseudomyrmex gracilis]